eukprot:TRINITY_DN2256_c0_g1_i1.p1 TRINITY_DN2256_c0_g1~~TRINITY_DN2256_c0_g1_i1.p1  ORF type:complete len:369 (-),score=52.90 TRINITY_DN2256_c0_g1_i1:36-1142(-)
MKGIFDIVVVGGGIAGTSVAHHFSIQGAKVLLLEGQKRGQGASGAAGCWINPYVYTRDAPLLNPAFQYTTAFYTQFPSFEQSGSLLRREKSNHMSQHLSRVDLEFQTVDDNSFFVPNSGFISNPTSLLSEILEKSSNVTVKENEEVRSLERRDELWAVNDSVLTDKVVLCTGHDFSLLKEPYFAAGVKRVWGEVFTFRNSEPRETSHANIERDGVMVAYRPDGIVTVGSTHVRLDETPLCIDDLTSTRSQRMQEIKLKAGLSETCELISVRSGVRGMPTDYLPVVGNVVDSSRALELYPRILKGQIVPDVPVHPNLFIISALGGRGFVLAPYLAKLLVSHIVGGEILPPTFHTKRLFQKWARRLDSSC